MHPNDRPVGHPIQERRAQGGGGVFSEQNDLEDGGFQARLEAIVDVAGNVAQEVHINDIVITLTGIQPDGEDEIFGR